MQHYCRRHGSVGYSQVTIAWSWGVKYVLIMFPPSLCLKCVAFAPWNTVAVPLCKIIPFLFRFPQVAVSLPYYDMGTGIFLIGHLMTLLFIWGTCHVKPSPTVAGWVHPSLDFKPWMVECCWPTLANRYFSQNPSSPLAVPKTIFLLSVLIQTWSKPAGLSQSLSPARKLWCPRSTEQFQPEKVALVFLCQKSKKPYVH